MTNLIQLYLGKNICQSNNDVLQPCSVEEITSLIKQPNGELYDLAKQLHTILRMDKAAYNRHKLRLPYICCCSFTHNIRNGKNFIYTESCIIDLDGFASAEYIRNDVLPAVKEDPHIVMAFISPSGKGLKILFGFTNPCSSLKEYSLFYKNFVTQWAQQYGLAGYADTVTCDAVRVCFLSHDTQVYVNPSAQPLNWQSYLPGSTSAAGEGAVHINNDAQPETPATPANIPGKPAAIAEETYLNITRRLNPTAPVRTPRNVFVPPILEDIAVKIQALAALNGYTVKDIADINYGKKIALSKGFAWGEVNVYYGKHGFVIVKSPKRGSDAAIALETEDLIKAILTQPAEINYINPDM
ncbi:CRISPR-associated primase-polymerase type B [Parafilimonas sp.]|uniref:CRISPR-associated primase-polymerase type B n=1 Tax=Parafilimonas sp. TaxID=1969739 RepID=UPI0039E583E8